LRFIRYLQGVALFLTFLVLSIPFIHAENLNLIYDGNGNLVTGDSFYREYDEFNQLIRVREGNLSSGDILEEFTWHPTEERILIKDVFYNGIKNYTVYYVSKEYILIENSTGNYSEKYVYQDGVLVGQIDTDGNKKAVHNDHLGSTSLITDSNGDVAENTFYSPYGEILQGGDKSRFDYTGKEKDEVTGEYDFNARMYKSDWGMFLVPDTLIQFKYDPQLTNRYSYTKNNPFLYVDPNGHVLVFFMGLGAKEKWKDISHSPYTDKQPTATLLYKDEKEALQFIQQSLKDNPNQPVIVTGHSLGAGIAMLFTDGLLKDAGIEADLVVTIDHVFVGWNKPENTKELFNIKESNAWFLYGKDIKGQDDSLTLEDKKVTHKNLPFQDEVINTIRTKSDKLLEKYASSNSGGGGNSWGNSGGGSSWCVPSCVFGPGVPEWEELYGYN